MTHKTYKSLFCLLMLVSVFTGCREHYEHLTFQPAETMVQPTDSNTLPDATEPAEPTSPVNSIGAVPYTYHLLPATERKSVFDTLLGEGSDVYFIQEPGRETLVTFDGDSDIPARMAQACRIGNKKSSVLILLGMSVLPQEMSAMKVYTFERGRAATVKPYTLGKDDFLEQFQNIQLMNRLKDIHGITGATPIWKPVAQQVHTSYELLLKDKANPVWIAGVKNAGKIWHRGVPEIADADLAAVEPQGEGVASPGPQDGAERVLPEAENTAVQPEPDSYDFMQDDSLSGSSENDLLYEHWQVVATAEITLLACGLLIVAVAQLKRAIYK